MEVKFARTPVMSTYLVAFVVGEYDFVETRSKDGVCVRVYTPVGKAEQGKFALEVNVLEEDCPSSPQLQAGEFTSSVTGSVIRLFVI